MDDQKCLAANHNGDTPGTSWGYHGGMMTRGSNEIGTDRLVFQLNNIDSLSTVIVLYVFVALWGRLTDVKDIYSGGHE